LGEEDEDIRMEAVKKLVALGEIVLPGLRLAASDKRADVEVRLRAAATMAAIHERLFGQIHCFKGHSGWVGRVLVMPDGKRAISSGDFLRVWDLESGKEVRHFAPKPYYWGLALSKDGKRALTSHFDHSVRLYEVETGNELQKFVGHTAEVWDIGLSGDGKFAVTGALDLTIRVWDLATGKQLRTFANVVDSPRCFAWSPDGKRVAIGHYKGGDVTKAAGTLRVWDFETGKELASGSGHTGGITAVSWSGDGKRIATSSFDGTLRVWDAATAKELKRITASPEGCDGVTFMPDGKRLVSSGWGADFAVRVWQIDTGEELVRYTGHTGGVACVAVTPDGKKAIACDTTGVLRLWPLPK
jgi:WD40 repeat protein